MKHTGRPRIVVLGMITKMPVGGVLWQALHYLEGFRRLGCDVYYVEAHARTPSHFVEGPGASGSRRAAAFLHRVFESFGFGDRWAFHALHDDNACYGMSESDLVRLYESADLLINLHGGTEPRAEFAGSGRLVFVGTDPVELEIELAHDRSDTVEMLDRHDAFFTFAENFGRQDCLLPVTDRYTFMPTRQPVVLDFWRYTATPGPRYTTVANWRQRFRTLRFEGEVYTWSKHHEFLKVIDLPERVGPRFELALSSIEEEDEARLRDRGWDVRSALDFSYDMDRYRAYIEGSRGEFTVAKDQNVRFRSGWFSDRSATYLAAGLPVITQETGFSGILPTGRGLYPFVGLDDVAAAVDSIEADHAAARRGALEVARECFSHDVVLGRMLDDLGVRPRRRTWPDDMTLEPRSRRPIQLADATVSAIRTQPLPEAELPRSASAPPRASVVVVTYDNLDLTRLCIESVLDTTTPTECELIVVDNASTDGTFAYLETLMSRPLFRVRALRNPVNEGFARACNRGLDAARGDVLILLNNDTIVPPGWLHGLCTPLAAGTADALNPVTNRIAGAAEVPSTYRTHGEFLEMSRQRAIRYAGRLRNADMLTMFCFAIRRDVWTEVGSLDESFGTGLFEDDDYSARLRAAGHHLAIAEDVFVHHFGEASFGKLYGDGAHSRLFNENRARFEEKWSCEWKPHGRSGDGVYSALLDRIRVAVEAAIPAGASVAVVSRGDERLLSMPGRDCRHFPGLEDGSYAGHYPADGAESAALVDALAVRGISYLVLPRPAFWWLDYYPEMRHRLEYHDDVCLRSEDVVVYRLVPLSMSAVDLEGVA